MAFDEQDAERVFEEYESVDKLPVSAITFIESAKDFYESEGFLTEDQLERLEEIFEEHW